MKRSLKTMRVFEISYEVVPMFHKVEIKIKNPLAIPESLKFTNKILRDMIENDRNLMG